MANTEIRKPETTIERAADRTAEHADDALRNARRVANSTLDSLQDKVDDLHDSVPGALSRAAARVDEITRRGMDRARDTSAHMRESVTRASDRTVAYIKDEPVKSVLIAAATGAAVAALVTLLSRSRRDHL